MIGLGSDKNTKIHRYKKTKPSRKTSVNNWSHRCSDIKCYDKTSGAGIVFEFGIVFLTDTVCYTKTTFSEVVVVEALSKLRLSYFIVFQKMIASMKQSCCVSVQPKRDQKIAKTIKSYSGMEIRRQWKQSSLESPVEGFSLRIVFLMGSKVQRCF